MPSEMIELGDLAKKANDSAAAVESDMRSAVQHAIECGKHLIEAKSQVKHGEWLPWLKENWIYSQPKAHRYIELANYSRANNLDSAESISDALRLIADAKAEAKAGEPEPQALFDDLDESKEPSEATEAYEDVDAIKTDEGFQCATCGNVFEEPVWHCQKCNQHWGEDNDHCDTCDPFGHALLGDEDETDKSEDNEEVTHSVTVDEFNNWTESEIFRRQQVEQGETVVANKKEDKRLIAWASSQGLYVGIDRGTPWGNPFVVEADGDRDEVCDKYGVFFGMKSSLHGKVDSLRGKVLGCWCYPQRCHGQFLISEIAK